MMISEEPSVFSDDGRSKCLINGSLISSRCRPNLVDNSTNAPYHNTWQTV